MKAGGPAELPPSALALGLPAARPVRTGPAAPVTPSGRTGAGGPAPGRPEAGSFADVLAETAAGLRISEHARQRLRSAGVGPAHLEAVGRAVERLAAHGGRESLVMCGDTAFLVSVRNRTLITVVPAERMRDCIFTNIDSAALVGARDITSGAGPAWEASGEGRA